MALPVNNIKEVLGALIATGISNHNVLIGTLCCIAKESAFIPKNESSYKNTDNARLRKLFSSHLSKYTEEQLSSLKVDDVKFYDAIYGGKLGNTNPGDGFKFRGRGFNQITFHDLYKNYGNMIKEDLVSNPDAMNDIHIAAKACAAFFNDAYIHNAGKLLSRYGIQKLNDVKDVKTGIQIAVNANAGWGNDTRGGMFDIAANVYLNEITTIFNSLIGTFNI